jgi:hypothetical protein
MFEFFKKRQLARAAREIDDQFKGAAHGIKAKWIDFVANVHFNSDVSLSQKIDAFAGPMLEWVAAKYPLVAVGPAGAGAYWLLVFTAVLESHTHSRDEVNAAVAGVKNQICESQTSTIESPQMRQARPQR